MSGRLRLLAATSLAAGLALLASPALAQDSPSPTTIPATTTTIEATTTTSIAGTTVTNEETTTTEAAVTTTEAPTTSVGGIVVNRPLPRTGGDFGLQVIVGAGLTAAGLAFAVTARLRRQQAHAGG